MDFRAFEYAVSQGRSDADTALACTGLERILDACLWQGCLSTVESGSSDCPSTSQPNRHQWKSGPTGVVCADDVDAGSTTGGGHTEPQRGRSTGTTGGDAGRHEPLADGFSVRSSI